ncbi:PEP_CTERM-anchored TLD domain-containing protein [Rhodovulum sp. DZ06]|uniref:PEP_CTERM-anchored TLD domain-containing protein n=1 Tax=Rhodovulum sp. DZ06 TaxID=3425126 RepID=UPI003D332EFD
MRPIALALAALLLAAPAHAATVNGATSTLSGAHANQLEAWLGQGTIALDLLFQKQDGDSSRDFHAAADGQGATFTVARLSTGHVIGGYNPRSWDAASGWALTPDYADRTAFLFNLTTAQLLPQRLAGTSFNSGEYQSFNGLADGPVFGGGADWSVGGDLTSSYSNLGADYGDGSRFGDNIYNNGFVGSPPGTAPPAPPSR